jgi:vitamin K-dependent gamma-carboxylase
MVSIILFFFCVADADRWGAAVKKEKTTIPYWQILIFRWQICIVYFYGGIAKIQGDWLSGFPMCYWLESISFKYPESLQPLIQSQEFAHLFSYTGLLFDLMIPFLLLSFRWRRLALIPVILFHTINDFTWDIGDFPTIMLVSSAIFFAPNWGEKAGIVLQKNSFIIKIIIAATITAVIHGWYNEDVFKSTNLLIKCLSYPILVYLFFRDKDLQEGTNSQTHFFTRKRASLAFLSVWFTFQLLFPFRHFLYKGNPSWTGEGHLFAWRMMLVDTADAWRMRVIIPETGEELPVALNEYINYRQYRKMRRTPKSFLLFAHFIRDRVIENGVPNPIIKMEVWKSVNSRIPQLVNDTTLNYAEVKYSSIAPVTWITDWAESDEKPVYSQNRFKAWQDFLAKDGTNYEWR